MEMKFYSPLTAEFFPDEPDWEDESYNEYEGYPMDGHDLVAGFCGALDRHSHLVQPGLAAEPARIGSQRTTQSFGGVDSFSLVAAVGLDKRTPCCFGERKSFSSTSLIKISDNVHAVS